MILKNLNVVIRPSDACNQNCAYCYVERDSRLRRGACITVERLQRFFRSILSNGTFAHVNIVWHGGEPTLLGAEYLQRAIECIHEVKGATQVEYAIQTNATALTDEMVQLFVREKVAVGISLDAPPDVHDRFRTNWSGKPTFEKVMAGIEKLHRAGIIFGAICVLHSQNHDRAREIYSFFKSINLNYQLNPFYRAEAVTDVAVSALAISPEQYGAALLETLDEYANDPEHTIDVKDLRDVMIAMMTGVSVNCLYRGACDEFIGIATDGRIYVCDNFNVPEALIGGIDTITSRDILQSKAIRCIKQRSAVLQTGPCRGCKWWRICRGGCSSRTRAVFGTMHRADPFCESRKVLFGKMSALINTLQKEEP